MFSDGRDELNTERFKSIQAGLKRQDRILWAIISVMGAVATGMAVVAKDILKSRFGID